jgi:SAM-dependent methyltransferase
MGEVSPEERRAFVAERRRASVQRYDDLHSEHYDENWGEISPSHAAFVERLTTLVLVRGVDVLDAACGTGKYWPTLLAAGLRVTGADQSAGMLGQARRLPLLPAEGPGARLARGRRVRRLRGAGGGLLLAPPAHGAVTLGSGGLGVRACPVDRSIVPLVT